MKEAFDFDKEYGIVLEGGGAKGAYQIGVWKAFLDCGVKIKGVAGVSVGALNGALICMGDYEKAVDLWRNISYSRIMKVDDSQMDNLINKRFKELNLHAVQKQGIKFIVDGGLDITPLKQLIEENLDEKIIKASAIEFIMGTFSVSKMKEVEISAEEAEEGCLKDYLMASAYLPLFKNERLHGKKYLDGGILNNVPINMLVDRGYQDIIVVRIFGMGLEKKVIIPEGVNVIYIAPKVELCNILEFNKKKAARNITLGYYDAMRVLKSLAGNDYYIESIKSEKDYLEALLQTDEKSVVDLLMLYKLENYAGGTRVRTLTEAVYPQLANTFKLCKCWEYSDLYYAILEFCARKLRIQKYKIYSEREFCRLIEEKSLNRNQEDENIDVFMNFALAIIKNQI